MRWGLTVLWLAVAAAMPAQAHTLEVATARVTLRDGQVAVAAHVDLLSVMQASRTADDVPLGILAVVDPDGFDAVARSAGEGLQRETTLHVDGQPVTTTGWSLPEPDALREEAQRRFMARAVDDPVHQELSAVAFEARVARPPSTVSVALPAAVGPVLVSFVQPVRQLADAGATVTVRVPPRSLELAPAEAPPGRVAAP